MATMATQFQNKFDLHTRAILGLPENTDLAPKQATDTISTQRLI